MLSIIKQHLGRTAQQPIWIFGVVDTSFQPARGYMEIVPGRDRKTLTDFPNRKLSAKSVIHLDEWRVTKIFHNFC